MRSRLPLPLLLVALARAENCELKAEGPDAVFEVPNVVLNATRTVDWPPSVIVETVLFNLCAPLPKVDDVPAEDQCPEGTRACFTRTAKKGETKLVLGVIPAGLDKEKQSITALPNGGGLDLTLQGGAYVKQQQSFVITLKCAKEATDPTFENYERGAVSVQWSTPAACPAKRDGGGGGGTDDNKTPQGSSGGSLRMFFLLFILAIVAYFAIGSYYNMNTYGASGWDVIPHKDFWRELPYLVQDLAAHLCSAFQPRTSRGGYVSV
ncbi:hypothetical protein EXIGLDRAFT_667597 [Exidia glandulosa HHB12029]|uniref:Autophagy-related protein 27 n=1 Tax=Exidia glandulosa HHB12029 TaxID=1314781 RepID=A0A165N5N4_EXIGL|nr:hypothetical protein EXIGLDRAFT_667597 [Exidia glandulosa HHB12029]